MALKTSTNSADLLIFSRVCRLVLYAGSALAVPTSASWLATALSRVDGGPLVDPRRLGPALRACGFHRSFRRYGSRRMWVWYPPGLRPARGRRCGRAQVGQSRNVVNMRSRREV
jgi:hypothetical protein